MLCFYFVILFQTSYLIGQGVEGWSFSCIKASMGGSVAKITRGGVSLDDDFSTVVGSSFGALSEAQLLSLDLQTHTRVSHDWESGHVTKMCCSRAECVKRQIKGQKKLCFHCKRTEFTAEDKLGHVTPVSCVSRAEDVSIYGGDRGDRRSSACRTFEVSVTLRCNRGVGRADSAPPTPLRRWMLVRTFFFPPPAT